MKAGTIVAAALITIVSSALPLLAQTEPVKSDFYFRSLSACLQARSEDHKNSDTRRDQGSVIVLREKHITRGFPTSVGMFRVEYLDGAALRRRHAQLKADFPVVGIAPVEMRGDLIVVRCSIYSFTVRTTMLVRRKLVLGEFGGWDVQWRYDCISGKYVIGGVKKWQMEM
jgi:hypothetical protein